MTLPHPTEDEWRHATACDLIDRLPLDELRLFRDDLRERLIRADEELGPQHPATWTIFATLRYSTHVQEEHETGGRV